MAERHVESYDVAIIGGGVIGLAVAHALTEGGSRRVAVIEAQTGSREASWAAGGMLAPYSEFGEDTPLFRLCCDSADMFPGFVARLREESGLPCTLVETGAFQLEATPEDAEKLDRIAAFLDAQGVRHELLDAAALRDREPAVAPEIPRALWVPERSVNNRQLWDALAEACRRRGVDLLLGSQVHGLERTDDRVEWVNAGDRFVQADTFVIAAGAWSGKLGDVFGITLPVYPIKGQIMRFDLPDETVHCTLHGAHTYVVPRPGYGVVIGATVEKAGFDKTVQPDAIAELAERAAGLVPRLRDESPCETWAGLRPKPPDGSPILGPAPGIANVVLATGHFRNGILLTPITGDLIAACVDGRPDDRLTPFAPDRFTS